jgi:tetratricopeptide (TPR) repeat protein
MIADRHRPVRRILTVLGLRTAIGLSAAAYFTLSAVPARAQSASDSATAQALFDRAKKLMREGKYTEACSALEESQRVESRSGTALNLADCYEHAGRLASAWSTFLEAATLAKATGNAAREHGARERAAALAPRFSNLVISAPSAASTPGLEIRRDGELVGAAQLGLPLPADAGKHTIAARAPGRKSWQTEVTVQNGASTANVAVPDLENDAAATSAGAPVVGPGATPAQSPQHVAPPPAEPAADRGTSSGVNGGAIAGGVVTGVFLVGTVVTSVLYRSKLHDYNTANDSFASNAESLRSQTKTLGVANMALLGGTVVAAGVTVYLWTRKSPSPEAPVSASVELRGVVGPGLTGVSLRGAL